ncbi:hypothetical protein GUJ93_ZPchr0710g2697 [Zizania palustris]|uniref:Uncharacterized protein n=1 Tax=Zizania palustris TaxID=103762 RepID=A0A8J5QVZ1_ZIZPA|nr:hypothetical protein GUJ93_ZPchr0710g2697 [Zizania palustris]
MKPREVRLRHALPQPKTPPPPPRQRAAPPHPPIGARSPPRPCRLHQGTPDPSPKPPRDLRHAGASPPSDDRQSYRHHRSPRVLRHASEPSTPKKPTRSLRSAALPPASPRAATSRRIAARPPTRTHPSHPAVAAQTHHRDSRTT